MLIDLSDKDIGEAYPHCPLAVDWCERVLKPRSSFGPLQDRFSSCALEIVRMHMICEICDRDVAGDVAGATAAREIMRQAEHPSFANYIRAKMGAL